MDYEKINDWFARGFSEDLISAALNEALASGVSSLRYIDKILYDWERKGVKNPEDIKRYHQEESRSNLIFEPSLLNLDWLNEK